ncbi:MAG: hypothetical protein GWP05_03690 [Anaerolineaceae bacterium]|nr:hypothetical protein [Anaerolineaceae bacterium]
MAFRFRRQIILVSALAGLGLALGGCAGQPFAAISLGDMNRQLVANTLGPAAVQTPDGYSLETHNKWPTIIKVVHVVVPADGVAQWKTSLTASVIHMMAIQTINIDAVYEGPVPEELVNSLRAPQLDDQNAFLARLIDFARQKTNLGLTEKWKNSDALKNDPYRSRFIGVLNFGWSDLRGRGRLSRTRFTAQVHGASSRLDLSSLAKGIYRIQMKSTVALGPLPVL